MNSTLLPLAGIALLLPCGQPPALGFGQKGGGKGPHFCVAKLEKDTVRVKQWRTGGKIATTGYYEKKTDRGVERIPYKIERETIEEFYLEVPSRDARAFDGDGKPLAAEKLAELLAGERPVVVFVGDPEPKLLPVFRKGTVILSLPAAPVFAPAHGGGVIIPGGKPS